MRYLFFILLLCRPLSAAPLTIAETRESIGKTAEITGFVATQTQGGDNTYLSFDGAYPRQTFTVQFNRYRVLHPEELEDASGRQVVVAGEVASGVHGPRMIVDDLRQISLLPVDEAAALGKAFDGAVERKLYSQAWRQIFQREEFTRIEAQAAAFSKKETRGRDGLLQSLPFYDGLIRPDGYSEESWSAAHDRLVRWRAKSPKSIAERLVEAGFLAKYAWNARGKGYGDTVSQAGWTLFHSRLQQAEKILASIPQSQRCPFYYHVALIVALGEDWEQAKVRQLLQESQKQCPDSAEPYFQVAQYLLPRWHGKPGEWEAFLDSETSGNTPFQRELYARVVWAQSAYYTAPLRYSDIFRASQANWEKMKTGFDEIVRKTPDSSWNLNSYARFAYIAKDRETCGPLIERIRGKEDMDVWLSWTNFQDIPDWLAAPETKE